MKVKRYKKAQRVLTFYRNNFNFRPPYQIILDGTFCQAALKNKVNISEQITKYLCDQVKLLTTVCVVNETEKLGPALYGAMLVVKQFPVHKCGHEKQPIAASACLRSLLTAKNSVDHYILATQDQALTEAVRQIPGSPILYLNGNSINLEKPSEKSERIARKASERAAKPNENEIETLKELKSELGLSEQSVRIKKRKPKGPNPLSVKKKKPKQSKPKQPTQQQHQNQETSSGDKKRRKRNRSKLKMPKQMAKLLAS